MRDSDYIVLERIAVHGGLLLRNGDDDVRLYVPLVSIATATGAFGRMIDAGFIRTRRTRHGDHIAVVATEAGAVELMRWQDAGNAE